MKKKQEDLIPVFKFVLTEKLIKACKNSDFKPEDFLPTRSEDRATGWDVRCAEPKGVICQPGAYYKMSLGFHMLAPEGWWLELKPRSSAFLKKNLHALYGTIDELYGGEMLFACQFNPDSDGIIARNNLPRIEFGERIGQLIPVKRQEMIVETCSLEELTNEHKRRNSNRSGGFGSTGAI